MDKIWELSDLNNKGFLDKQDFLVAHQLIEKYQRGEGLPTAQQMDETRKRCAFDLCSDCVKKNNEAGIKNVCFKGHKLYPTVNLDLREWFCDECQFSPEQNLDPDVLVWRCQHDKRSISWRNLTKIPAPGQGRRGIPRSPSD